MIREKLLRDPVHDLIALDQNNPEDRVLLALADAPELQRLRRVRQMGLASLAYQGAEHSRFSHSLGVMWIATRILDRLGRERRLSTRQRLVTRCAAMLHDTGHGPLSHVFELFLGTHHEDWTHRIIRDPGSGVNRILREAGDRRLPREVSDTIAGRSRPAFLSQIISSQLDADRFDYLLRDSLMTGVKYGVFDLERILHILRIDATGQRIVIAGNGVMPVEKYLQARYGMYLQVYLHKTVRAAEALLGKTLLRAADLARKGTLPGIAPDEPIARLLRDGERVSMEDYLLCDDDSVYSCLKRWRGGADPVLADLSGRILDRRLFKTLDVSRVTGLARRMREAGRLLRDAGLDPRYYLILDESGNAPYKPYDPTRPGSAAHILVEEPGRPGKFVDIHDLSEVVRGLTRAAFKIRRAVFPAEDGHGRPLRAKIEAIFRG